MELSSQQKDQLFSLVHHSIKAGLKIPSSKPPINESDDLFNQQLGVFVTLTINNKLRGCVGYIQPETELNETIINAAYQAAFNDPRFNPLSEDEYGNVKIEISILSQPFDLNSYSDIVIGKHGLILEYLNRKALLLPQVPLEHNLNRNEYLSALCSKAGFVPEYWKQKDLKLKAFTAFVFSE